MASTSSITQIRQTQNNAVCNAMFFPLFHMHAVSKKHLWKKLRRTCSNEPTWFHKYTIIETRLSKACQDYPVLQGYSNPWINMSHTNIPNWIPPRIESYFNSFMSSPLKLDHIPRLKNMHIYYVWSHRMHMVSLISSHGESYPTWTRFSKHFKSYPCTIASSSHTHKNHTLHVTLISIYIKSCS